MSNIMPHRICLIVSGVAFSFCIIIFMFLILEMKINYKHNTTVAQSSSTRAKLIN